MEVELRLTDHYKPSDNKVLIGSEEGLRARKELDLDNKDNDGNNYTIIFDDNIRVVTLSFLYPMFKESHNGKTRKEMLSKYKLKYEGEVGHPQKVLENNYKEILEWIKGV